jgi:hypothetical protein
MRGKEGDTRVEHGRTKLDPVTAYYRTMLLIRHRFVSAGEELPEEAALPRAERIALQVRKIVEGVAFAALSAVERRSGAVLDSKRGQDADKLLLWMERKGLLRLPAAQRLDPTPVEGFATSYSGSGDGGLAAGLDLDVPTLMQMFSRASNLVHERHPERLADAQIEAELAAIEDDLRKLNEWLWLHIMFLRGEGFLVQMGQFGTSSFMVPLTRLSELPADV